MKKRLVSFILVFVIIFSFVLSSYSVTYGATNADVLRIYRKLKAEPNFMDEIYKLETRRCTPPLWGWGDYVAKVVYDNGDVELLGSRNIEFVEIDISASGEGNYCFWERGIFEEVFLRYLD